MSHVNIARERQGRGEREREREREGHAGRQIDRQTET